MPAQQSTAGWYADPRERFVGRYFDGTRWTSDVCQDDLQPQSDPLGLAPSPDPAPPAMAGIGAARRLAAENQEMIRRGQVRVAGTATTRELAEHRGRLSALSVVALVACIAACLAWWAGASGSELAVVTKVSEAPSDQSNRADLAGQDPVPKRLAFADVVGETAMQPALRPALSDTPTGCSRPSPVLWVGHTHQLEAGHYNVALCDGLLRLTPAYERSGIAATELIVGDGALVLPNGVIVTWRPADSTRATPAAHWDITFWGGEDDVATTIRAPAVLNELGVPRPPTPLPGGYVIAVPVDSLLSGAVIIDRPSEVSQPTGA